MRTQVSRITKVHQLGRGGEEIKEVGFDEAKLIVEDAGTWGYLVTGVETQEVTWEIGPEVEEIMIFWSVRRRLNNGENIQTIQGGDKNGAD